MVSTFDPEQLTMLARVLDAYCRERGIPKGSPDREDVTRLMVALFRRGYQTAGDLKEALEGEAGRQALAQLRQRSLGRIHRGKLHSLPFLLFAAGAALQSVHG